MNDLNAVALTARLTRDPELRHTAGGTPVCSLRVAFNTRTKGPDGSWGDKGNFIDVTVWGAQGERVAEWGSKGRRVAIKGRLEWREWEANGTKRQQIDVVADDVIFLDRADDTNGSSGGSRAPHPADQAADYGTPAGATASGGSGYGVPGDSAAGPDDDIPF